MGKAEQICSRCKTNKLKEPLERNALSRVDNATLICSECGTAEALEEFIAYEKSLSTESNTED